MCNEKITTDRKHQEVLNCQQCTKIKNVQKILKLNVEKAISVPLLEMKEQELVIDKSYSKLRITGDQLASLYGLAETHKKETQFRPVLSLLAVVSIN